MDRLPQLIPRLFQAAAVALAITGTAATAYGQPGVNEASASRFDFGQVRVGSKVEGSVNFYFEGTWTDGVPMQIFPPPFATVSESRLYHQEFGPGNDRVVASVFLKVATEQAGVAEGDLSVRVGDHEASVPIRADVVEDSPDAVEILIVDSPFDRHFGDFNLLEGWRKLVAEAGLDPHYVNSQTAYWFDGKVLSDFDVVIVGGSDLVRISSRSVEALLQFARDGGRVFVTASAYSVPTVPAANQLLEPAGLRMEDTESHDMKASLQVIEGDLLAEDPALEGIGTVVTFRGSPIQLLDPSRAKLLIAAPDFPDRGYAAVAKLGEGEIVVLGQALWATWIDTPQGFMRTRTPERKTSDNARFLKNVLTLKDWPDLGAKEQAKLDAENDPAGASPAGEAAP